VALAALALLLPDCEGFGGDCESHADCQAGQCCLDGQCVFQGESPCPTGDADTDADTDSDTDVDTDPDVFTGLLMDFGTRVPLQGMTVTPLDSFTGEPLAGFDAAISTSDSFSNVTFTGLPPHKVGLLVDGKSGAPGFVDTYQFNIASDATDQVLWSVDEQTFQLAPAAAGLMVEPDKGQLFGGLFWVDSRGYEQPVACGSVRLLVGGAESGDVRYFSDAGMPTTYENQSNINPANGFFLVANIDPGLAARLVGHDPHGNRIAEVTFPVFGSTAAVGNLLVEPGHAENPGGCD
jgi:hypothetical protein